MLCANKLDLPSQRVISSQEGEQLAKEFKTKLFEVSAKNGTNINQLFIYLSELLLTIPTTQTHVSRRNHNAIAVVDSVEKEEKGGCC